MIMQYRNRIPTVEEAREFHRLINVGRTAAGLEELEYLDFDGANSGSAINCLSARNLFRETGWMVWSNTVSSFRGTSSDYRVIDALGMTNDAILPDAFLRITDPFDAIYEGGDDVILNDDGENEELRNALRGVLVEAGVVEP